MTKAKSALEQFTHLVNTKNNEAKAHRVDVPAMPELIDLVKSTIEYDLHDTPVGCVLAAISGEPSEWLPKRNELDAYLVEHDAGDFNAVNLYIALCEYRNTPITAGLLVSLGFTAAVVFTQSSELADTEEVEERETNEAAPFLIMPTPEDEPEVYYIGGQTADLPKGLPVIIPSEGASSLTLATVFGETVTVADRWVLTSVDPYSREASGPWFFDCKIEIVLSSAPHFSVNPTVYVENGFTCSSVTAAIPLEMLKSVGPAEIAMNLLVHLRNNGYTPKYIDRAIEVSNRDLYLTTEMVGAKSTLVASGIPFEYMSDFITELEKLKFGLLK